ncbi:MAG TPA: type IV toxin-antitoxin system AbiEi family antitoxin domain-containing protein [Solirubrobacterales bacterium]|nr:type IV toxin-antitoxin system AbiEi family antitoxin domain-containing protein [Solirubrobacterales bacterium]
MPPADACEFAVTRHIGGKLRTRPSDRIIGELARRQHGVVTRAQLIELGLGEDAIDTRLSGGRLYRLHRGVYAFGHGIVPIEGHWLAAVLRVGEGAVMSHRSAAELWGIRRGRERARVDVSTPRRTRSLPAIRRHCMQLAPDEATTRRSIPVTTLVRTLFDIASEASAESFEGAIREAEYLYRFRIEDLEDLLDRHPGRRGAKTIKTCLHRLGRGPRGRTRSRLEVRFAGVLARSELPNPELNVLLDIDGFKVEADCLWREQRLIVELDGGQAHRTRVAFESDRERDRRLQAAGWRVIRITWRQLDDPAAVLADLRRLLSSRLHFPAI